MKRVLLGVLAIALTWSCTDPKTNDAGKDGVSFDEVVKKETADQEPKSANPKLDSLNLYLISDPNNVDALVARTKEYIRLKNLKYAFADAVAVHQLDSTNADVLLVWGEVHFFMNKTRVSRDSWVECARLEKENVDCRLKLAELYHAVGEHEKSLKMAREVTKIDGENATAYLILGLDYRDGINDTVTALKYIQKAIDLQEDYFEAIEHAALLYTYMANPLAEGYYDRMTLLQPDNYLVYYNRGIFYHNIEDWNNALESLTQASQLDPKNPEIYMTLGMVHLKINALPEAEALFTKAIEFSPSGANYRAYYSRGYANELQGDFSNAVSDYQQARQFNPTYEPAKIALQRLANQVSN
jgi:tetratricopeptide (TPR) repeat protein